MTCEFSRLIAACLVVIGVAWMLPEPCAALPLTPSEASKRYESSKSTLKKAHGFHCRRMFGWDPVAGVYHPHSHPGICRDYERCIRVQKRCVFVLGRGFQRWSYEAFGADNDRFTKCMIRRGCY